MQRAVNPQTGEVLFLVDNKWTPPAQTAKNDAGDTAYLVGNRWEVVKTARLPEPILSPEEQARSDTDPEAGRPSTFTPPTQPLSQTGNINSMTADEYRAQVAAREAQGYDRTLGGSVVDTGVTFLKGAIGLPEAFVGLADIPTLGYAGKLLEQAGYRPKEAKAILDTYLSEAQQYANRQVKETKGFLPTIGAALQNPSTIVTAVGESLPQMIGGAGVARGILKGAPGLSPYLAGAAGEGILGAGAAAEQIRQGTKDGLLTGKQALSAFGSGVGTAAFGVAGGKLAKKFGFDDIDTLLVGGGAQTGSKSVKDFATRATASGISEGVFEEMPQSAQETMWMNYATDKPLLEGVPEAAGMGLVTGFTMGVGATALGGRRKQDQKPESPSAPEAGIASLTPPPPAPPAPPAAPIIAPPSEAMDTQAMLAELIDSINPPKEARTIPAGIVKTAELDEAQVKGMTDEQLGAQVNNINLRDKEYELVKAEFDKREKEAKFLAEMQDLQDDVSDRDDKYIETPPLKVEAPKEPTLKEQYDKAAKLNLLAPDAFRDRRITQEQYDKIESDYERIKTEYQASIPKETLTPIQQEATVIADGLEELGQNSFVTGMRSAIAKNQVTKDNLDFYRSRLKQEQAKQNALDEGIERPSEKFEWTNFFRNDPKDLNKLKLFNSKAPPAVKQALQTVTDTLQALTNRLNDEGYTMYGTPSSTIPQDIKNLRSQIQMRSAGGVKLINAFEALDKGFNRSKKTTNQENLDAAIQDIKVDAAEAQKALQRSIPEPEEIVNARETLAEARKQMDALNYKSGSLWSALAEKLDPEEVREIFGANPSFGNKKLQVTKKSGKRGTYVTELAANGLLDTFLPPKMRHKSDMFDAAESAQYIKDAVANKDYLPHDVKEEIENIQKAVGPLGDLIDEYLTIEEQNRELQIAFDEQREADQAAEIVEPEGEDRPAEPSERPAGEFKLTAPTKDELKAKQDEIDRLSKENERLSKEADRKAKADEQAAEFTLTGSDREADQAASRGQRDIFAEEPKSTGSKSLDALRGVKFTPDEDDKKAIAIYKKIKENNPEADLDEKIANPNRNLPVEEIENRKGLKIGDLVYEKGDPNPNIVITVSEEDVTLVDPNTGKSMGSVDIENVSKDPIPYDYKFDFGYGEINVNVNRWMNRKDEWSVEMIGPGASETGYRNELGLTFKSNRGTPAFKDWVEKVVRIQTKEMAEPRKLAKGKKDKKKAQTELIEEAPKDNKQEIADLRKEQKSLMLQIIKAGMQETPVQEARMAEIENRINELEGKPAKPVVKQRSVEEIEEDLQDLEDQIDGEILKEKRMPLIEKLSKLEGELSAAKGRAARAAAEAAPTEAETEAAEEPSYEVETPDGNTLRYPAAYGLVNDGYTVLALNDPRTYTDKSGKQHRTFEKDGVRLSLSPQIVLFQDKNRVLLARGNEKDVTLEVILVDSQNRGQGKASQALKDLVDIADKNGLVLYAEPTPLKDKKTNQAGLDFDQLVKLYKKVGFDFPVYYNGPSTKVMERAPQAEVLPAIEPQIAGQVGFEPFTVEGESRIVDEEVAQQVAVLPAPLVNRLEKHYGVKRDTAEFIQQVQADIAKYVTEGAQAVASAIRSIIKSLAEGVLAVGIVFNPNLTKDAFTINLPRTFQQTIEIVQEVPAAAKSQMSPTAQSVYQAMAPVAIRSGKWFMVADKPNGMLHIFEEDGSHALSDPALYGKDTGDVLTAVSSLEGGAKITPAGKFTLEKAGKESLVLVETQDYSGYIAIHAADTSNKAENRLGRLASKTTEDNRISYGCINTNHNTFRENIAPNIDKLNGGMIFVLPDAQDQTAQMFVPETRTETKTEGDSGVKYKAAPTVVGREQQFFSIEGKKESFLYNLGDDMVRLVNQIADSIAENEKKRSPSFKRTAKTLTRQRGEGKITDEEYLERMNAAIEEDDESRLDKATPQRVRGADFIREKLLNAKRRQMITAEGVDLAEWFIQQNPALVDDLGISVKGKGLAGVGGFYNSDARIINLIKDAGSSQTATHEILHHLERMMPTDIQNAIRKAWLTQLLKANKAAKDPAQRLYFMTLLDAHIGNNNHDRLEIPKDLEKIYKSAVKQMQFASVLAGDPFGSSKSSDLAKNLLLYSPTVSNDLYEYFDPSEFWAVNGSDIVQARYEAVKGGVLARLKNWLREFTQTIKSLLGLKSDASIIRALDSLAKSDGKFVTRQMLGTGEYRSIERRNYQGGQAPEPDMEIPEMSFMDDVIYNYGDKLIDTKRLIQSIKSNGRKLDEKFDAYMKEENYHGRLAKRTKDFLNDEMSPVLVDMQEKGVTLDELETFLLNRHAKEANAYIAKINPIGFPEAGSSVSDADADKYMAELTPEKRKDLMALAAKVDAIVKETQQVLVANGLETEETIEEWNKTYKNYVPLQRDQLDFVHTGRGVMGGFATRGSASKRRVGSDKPVIDIFANIAMQRERALRRSEQARVGRALYGMAIKHPNPGFWLAINPDAIKDKDKLEAELISLGLRPEDAQNIIQEPRQPMYDKKTGQVKYQVNPLLRNSPNVFPVRINGEDRFIFFNPNNPRALRMVQSMRNLDTEKLGDAIGVAGMITRWFASVNTQYNIVFGGVNFLRDLGAASLNLSTTELAGKEKQVRANVLPALRAIYRDLRGKGSTTQEMAAMQKMFERFQLAGGQTGYQNQFAETKRKGNVVEQELKRLNRGNVKKSVDAVFNWLSDYNDAIENAVRLSAFKVAVESGLSDDKAASIAKNLTVNFNRKGARTGLISSLYAFFNAAVQGSARMVETLRGPMGKKIIFGGMFLGSMQAIALAMAGFDDDEPPEFVKDKNLIIPIPFTDKKYLAVPMPLGFNMFPGFGRLAMEALLIETGMIRSRKGPGDKVMSAVSLVFDAFNPLGGAGNPLLMAMPTILDPFAAIYSNKDAFGRPIYREDKGNAPTPGYERSRENASVFSKKLAEAINYVTSPAGTQHTKGFFSPTADQIDYFIGQITGGVGREIMKVGEFAKSKAVTQEEIPAYKLPIVGRFYGEAESPAATRSRFYENVKEMSKHEYEIKGLRKDKVSPAEYVKANPEARLWQRANNVENQVSKLNKEKRAMLERDAPREALKRKEDEILKKMTEFNDQVRRGQ